MDGEWQTYRQVAARIGCSVEAARRRALRGKWPRTKGNDGAARVRPPADLSLTRAPDVPPDASPDNSHLVSALEAHVATLKEQLAASEARLAAATAQGEAERDRASAAIAAFSALADRLDALASARQPFWKRLLRAG